LAYPLLIRMIYLLLTVCATLALIYASLPLDSKWIIWSALLLMLVTTESFWSQCFIITVSGLLSAVIILLGEWLVPISYLMPLYTSIILAVAFYFIRYYAIHLWAMLPFSFFIILGNQTDQANKNMIVLSIVAGTVAALLPQLITYWHFAKRSQQVRVHEMLKQLKILNQEIFNCYLVSQYQEEKYIYERRIHQAKKYYLRASLSLIETFPSQSLLKQMANHFDNLFDIMMSVAQLRARIEDFSIFDVCCAELTAIRDEFDELLKEFSIAYHHKNPTRDVKMFQQQIQQLETLYQRVLQVAAPDPFVFVLFIGSLNDAARELENLMTLLIQTASDKGN
jgi:hypothetical protein